MTIGVAVGVGFVVGGAVVGRGVAGGCGIGARVGTEVASGATDARSLADGLEVSVGDGVSVCVAGSDAARSDGRPARTPSPVVGAGLETGSAERNRAGAPMATLVPSTTTAAAPAAWRSTR